MNDTANLLDEDHAVCTECNGTFHLDDLTEIADDVDDDGHPCGSGEYVCDPCKEAWNEAEFKRACEAEDAYWRSPQGQAELEAQRREAEEEAAFDARWGNDY